MNRIFSALVVSWLILAPSLSAHYLWVTVDQKANNDQVANVYFEESPAPGDGHYLDHFIGTSKTWIRTLRQPQPRLLTLAEMNEPEKRWLQTPLQSSAPRSIDAYGKFGVYAYGKTKVLLHYYARNLDVRLHDDLHELGRAEQIALDIVPHDSEEQVELTVLWKGKPVAGRMVYIRGPGGFRKNPTTDQRGRVTFTPQQAGSYRFRSSVEENIAGEERGEKYQLIRHNVTMLLTLPLEG
jgi:hypothetical protein